MSIKNYFSSKGLIQKTILFTMAISMVFVFTYCKKTETPPKDKELAFIGSESCMTCHSEKYNDWLGSGHPYKFTVIENGMAPVYPVEAVNFQATWMSDLGNGHTWSDIAGVIGGYGWKARFIGTDGHIVGSAGSAFSTGVGHNQINFFGGELHNWSNYETTNTNKIYNYACFKCHTTGGEQEGTWLPGVEGLGTFSEGGIGCESCHGPGSLHVDAPSKTNIDRVYEFAHLDNSIGGLDINGTVQTPNESGNDVNFLCGTCHNRSYTSPINAGGGFINHHEQWDEFVTTSHYGEGQTCITCHDPHKRTIWDGDGIKQTCGSCHPSQVTTTNHSSGATCIDCHMPFAGKSGTKIGESTFRGDIRSHLMKITPDTESMFTADGSAVKDDLDRVASLSPAYSCLGCHNNSSTDGIADKTLSAAAASALNMHVTK